MSRSSERKDIANLTKALAGLAKKGIVIRDVDPEAVVKEARQKAALQSRSESMDAVLNSLERPHAFIGVACKHCGEMFLTNSKQVAYCNDICRAAWLRIHSGLDWTHKTPEERYGGAIPPMILEPEVLAPLLSWSYKVTEAAIQLGLDPQLIVDQYREEQAEVKELASKSSKSQTSSPADPRQADLLGIPQLPDFSMFE